MLLLLTGCAQKHYAPALSTDFNTSALYKAGDFSCSCSVEMKNNVVTVTALSGKVKGTTITYDGKSSTFSLNGTMQKIVSAAETPPKNPAKLLYTVFTSLKDCDDIKIVNNKYNYVGQTEAGSFLLVQRTDDDKYESVYIADADIKFVFV